VELVWVVAVAVVVVVPLLRCALGGRTGCCKRALGGRTGCCGRERSTGERGLNVLAVGGRPVGRVLPVVVAVVAVAVVVVPAKYGPDIISVVCGWVCRERAKKKKTNALR
jgi:hypothetical protein